MMEEKKTTETDSESAAEETRNENVQPEPPVQESAPVVPNEPTTAEQTDSAAAQIEKLRKSDRTKTIVIAVLAAVCVTLAVVLIVVAAKKPKDNTVTFKWEGASYSDEEPAEDAEQPYKPREDVSVQCTYVSGTDAFIIVKNDSADTLIDYTVAYVAFDAAGNAVNHYNDKLLREEKVTTANLLPGTCSSLTDDIYIPSDSNIKYIQATLTYAKFKGGEVWQATGVNAWAEETAKNFTIDAYKASVESMKQDAEKAQECPYLKVTKATKYHSNRYSDSHDLEATVRNTGEKTIKTFTLVLAEYDARNYPTKYKSGSYFTPNSLRAICNPANIEPGDDGTVNWTLVFSGTCETFNYIISEIEFDDGTTWQNPYAAPWLIYNEQKR